MRDCDATVACLAGMNCLPRPVAYLVYQTGTGRNDHVVLSAVLCASAMCLLFVLVLKLTSLWLGGASCPAVRCPLLMCVSVRSSVASAPVVSLMWWHCITSASSAWPVCAGVLGACSGQCCTPRLRLYNTGSGSALYLVLALALFLGYCLLGGLLGLADVFGFFGWLDGRATG